MGQANDQKTNKKAISSQGKRNADKRARDRNARTGGRRTRKQVPASAPETPCLSLAVLPNQPPAPDTPPLTDAFDTPPANPDSLHAWIERVLGVRIARTPLIDGHAAPFDYLCHSFFEGTQPARPESPPAPSPDCILWANRGGGKTFLGAIATLLDLLFKPKCQVRILAGSLEQARRMHEHLRGFIESDALAGVPRRITARRISLRGRGSAVEVLAASQTSVRGTRVQKLRCDEVDLFDPEVWTAAQLVTRSIKIPDTGGTNGSPAPWGDRIRGSVEALSTMHRPFGLMWKLVGDVADPAAARASIPNGEDAPLAAAPPGTRTIFRWGVLDVLEHCTDEHSCDGCPLFGECRGRAKSILSPASGGHISISDAIDLKSRVGRETWDSEMLCLRPSRSSTVYPEFDRALHVLSAPRAALPTEPLTRPFAYAIAGIDFAHRAESVVLLAGVTHDGAVVVLREHCREGQVIADQIAALNQWIAEGLCARPGALSDAPTLEWIGIDPAGLQRNPVNGESCAKHLRDAGFVYRTRGSEISYGVRLVRERIVPAWPGWVPRLSEPGGSVLFPRSRPVRSALPPGLSPQSSARLVIDPSCTRLIQCLSQYRYDQDKPESLNPVKDGHDHACDALRYMILNLDAESRTQVERYA